MPALSLLTLLVTLFIVCVKPAVAQKDEALFKAATERKPAFIVDLQRLVNIDSGTGDAEGLARVESILAGRLQSLGAQVQRIPVPPPGVGNILLATLKGRGVRKAMLMVHYDTVFPPGEAAKRPFLQAGNRASGPGVADAKSGLLLILNAMEMLRERGFNDFGTISVLFNPDEERSSLGSRALIGQLAAEQDLVLSFEPPEKEQVIVATNGIAYVHLEVTGVSSHAGSAPEQGRNAAMELAHQVLQLKDLGDSTMGTTVNWTVLQSGERVNVIPDRASATADMRLSVLSELQRVQQDANRIVEARMIPDTTVRVRVENRRPPFSKNVRTDALAETARAIYREIGKELDPVAMRFGTDAGFAFDPSGRTQSVLEGMGIVGDKLHSADEWADLDSIVSRLYLTVRLLENRLSPDR